MKLLPTGAQGLRAEAALALATLRDRRLAALLAMLAALLLLAAQAPLSYAVDVGVEDGPGSDLPLVAGFHPREQDLQGTFRWTKGSSLIRLPGVGARPLILTLRFIAVSPEVAERGPQAIELWSGGALAARLPVRPQGAAYRVALPPPPGGDLVLELRSPTIVPTGDARAIGAGLAAFSATAPAGPALPAWGSTLGWLAAAALAWLALRRAGLPAGLTLAALGPLALLVGLAALLDPPRLALGAAPAVTALALGWATALLLCAPPAAVALLGAALTALGAAGAGQAAGVFGPAMLLGGALRPAAARLAARLGLAIPAAHWRWLAIMAVVLLATRYGGKIYPDSMPGDIGFHVNRFADVARGTVLIISRNRGVDFPYPPALYLLLAPLTLAGADRATALRLGGALLDALSPALVYLIARGASERAGDAGAGRPAPLVAAGLYAASAATLMTTWWNFSTHIFAQFAHLLLLAALVAAWPLLAGARADEGRPAWSPQAVAIGLASLVVLQLLVYLGHFGFWMNMSLLGGAGVALLALAAWRGRGSWGAVWRVLAALAGAQALAALLFYSGYAGMFAAQAQAAAAGGLTGLAGREPVSRATLWHILWDYGLRTHFGLFPIPLALCGGLLLWRRRGAPAGRRALVAGLMAGTLAVALLFAVLPFATGSTLSSRWLMFSAWAVAVGASLAAERLWRAGRAGRAALLAAGGYTLWITISMWLTAMVWRVRPPEPF